MTLFPSLNQQYYVDNDSNVLKLMDYTYSKNILINQSYWSEADLDNRFEAGDMTLWNDIYGNVPSFRKRQFNFNMIRPMGNMVSGVQRQHRKSTICTPIESSDQKTADQFTKLLFHVNTQGHVYETISEAFHQGAFISGMNLLSVWLDYRSDPVNGDICIDNLSYNSFLIDPYFKKMDLSDCANIWVRKFLTPMQACSLLPNREKELKNLPGWGNRDGKFQFMPESYNYAMQDQLIYDEFWYQDTRKQKRLVDTQNGESMEWNGSPDDLQDFLQLYPQVTVIENIVPTVKLAIVVQGRVMYHGPNPLNIDSFPFVPVWGFYRPEIPYFPWRVSGMVRSLRDPAYLYNRTKVIQLDILESQISSGYLYKESALVNPKDVYMQGQGRGLALKDSDQPIENLVRKIEPPRVDPSHLAMSESLENLMPKVSGISENILGMAQDDISGIHEMLRQGASLTTLQPLFDNLDFSQKLLGNLTIQLIQKNWTPGKIERILGEKPSDQFYNKVFQKYNCVIEEGLNTSTQRQMQFAQLLQMQQLGMPIPPDLLVQASTLQNKNELVEALKQQAQNAQQQQQAQGEAQLELLKAQIEDLKSKAMANEGLGMERASRIHENRALAVERIAQAQRDRDNATLDKIKAAKELVDIDLHQLEKAISIIRMLQGADEADAVRQTDMALSGTAGQSAGDILSMNNQVDAQMPPQIANQGL